jgi:hypothetical protein
MRHLPELNNIDAPSCGLESGAGAARVLARARLAR